MEQSVELQEGLKKRLDVCISRRNKCDVEWNPQSPPWSIEYVEQMELDTTSVEHRYSRQGYLDGLLARASALGWTPQPPDCEDDEGVLELEKGIKKRSNLQQYLNVLIQRAQSIGLNSDVPSLEDKEGINEYEGLVEEQEGYFKALKSDQRRAQKMGWMVSLPSIPRSEEDVSAFKKK